MSIKRRFSITPLFVFALAVAGNSCSRGTVVSEPAEVIQEHDIAGLNKPLEENVPTVDIVMFHSNNTEVTWAQLREEFTTADEIFRSYGVQLHLERAFEVAFPPSWQGMASGEGTNVPTDEMELDFYELMDYEQEVLPESLEAILNVFIPEEEGSEHTIFVIPFSGLTVSWYERDENNAWARVTSPTSAISFPPYLFADRVPKHLRGVISFQRSHANRRVLAHELGHILNFEEHNFFGKIWMGFRYFTSRNVRRLVENTCDKIAIEKGYARGLFLAKSKKRKKKKYDECYLSPEKVKSYAKKIGKW